MSKLTMDEVCKREAERILAAKGETVDGASAPMECERMKRKIETLSTTSSFTSPGPVSELKNQQCELEWDIQAHDRERRPGPDAYAAIPHGQADG